MTEPDSDSHHGQNGSPPLGAVCGEIDIRIDGAGLWHYHGSPIGRKELVKLFSSFLQRDENGDFWLITATEKGRIKVDEAPFMAVVMTVEGEGEGRILYFETNVGDTVCAGKEHPIRVETDPKTAEPSPYVRVRGDRGTALEAKISRPVFYDLAELAVEQETPEGRRLGVWSGGCFFVIGDIEADC